MEMNNHLKSYRLPPIDTKANPTSNDDSTISAQEFKSNKNDQDPNKLQIIDEEETKNYIDDMKKGSYNILVAVRCRPLSNKEKEISQVQTVKVLDKKMVVLMDPIEYNAPNDIFKNRSREQTYAFDFAFEQYTNQITIFNDAIKFLLEGVVNGFNATVFAYGATGAGKTYTMLGNEDNPGIMPLTLMELFNKINQYSNEREYRIKLTYLEIYNENIKDLLCSNDDCLELREDPTKGITVSGITELNVASCRDILQLLKRGNKNRTQEATGANETSSRSHAILQVSVEYKDKTSGIEIEIKYGKLSLIDLAGSERASATMNRGIRLIEGANINRSLLTLGNCINALCDANTKGTKNYVPYRDSKLTRLLKDSLGGNARTIMIANIAPSLNTFDDTYNTLNYANRAKNIKTFVQRNVLNAQYHISNYVTIINKLKNEIVELKQQLSSQQYGANNNLNTNTTFITNTNTNGNGTPNLNTGNTANTIPAYQSKYYQNNFDKAVSEIKALCEQEIALKQKVIGQQIELGKLVDQFNNLLTSMGENSMMMDEGSNSLGIGNGNNNNGNEKLNKTEVEEANVLNDTKEAIESLEKTIARNIERLKEFPKIIDRTMTNMYDSGFRDFYFDYIQNIVKTHKTKILLIDNKYQSNISKAHHDIKDDYIKLLEQQIKERDNYMTNNNIPLPYNNTPYTTNDKELNKDKDKQSPIYSIKPLKELHKEYKEKVPIINQNGLPSSSSSALASKMTYNYNYNYNPTNNNANVTANLNCYSVLPPITRHNNKLLSKRQKSPYYSNAKIKHPYTNNEKTSLIRNYSQNLKSIRAGSSRGKEEKKHSFAENALINRHVRTNSTLMGKCSSSRGVRRNVSGSNKIMMNYNNINGNGNGNGIGNGNGNNSITQIHSLENSIMEADVETSLTLQKKMSDILVSEANKNNSSNKNIPLVTEKPLQIKKSDLNMILNDRKQKQLFKGGGGGR